MKAEGLRSGVWDIFLPAKRGNYGGLFVENKYGKNKLTTEQEKFKQLLKGQYDFAVCYSWIEAKIVIIHYLSGERF
jgi:hypothetical protein